MGPNILLTARHCTYHDCLGEATEVKVRCGQFKPDTASAPVSPFGTAFATGQRIELPAYTQLAQEACKQAPQTELYNADVQLLQLDRNVGLLTNYLDLASADLSINTPFSMAGYPSDIDLEPFLPLATASMVTRTATGATWTTASSRLTAVEQLWAWSGESGSPYWINNTTSPPAVAAVHVGGETGCLEYGCQVPVEWQPLLKQLRSANGSWSTSGHCHVMELHADVWKQYRDLPLKGSTVEASLSSEELAIRVTGTLVNMGTAPANHVQAELVLACDWSLGSGFVDAFVIHRQTLVLSPKETRRLQHDLSHTLLEHCEGNCYLGWTWRAAACEQDEPQWLLASIIEVRGPERSMLLPLALGLLAVGLLITVLSWVLTRRGARHTDDSAA